MRNHMERLVVLPFSFGCASHSSVQLGAPKKRPKDQEDSKATIIMVPRRREGEERSIIKGKMKRIKGSSSSSSSGFLVLPKPNVATGIQRLIRGIKSLSQFLFYKEDIEEMEHEMEIGYPTDVKHVTHIGLDGSTTTNTSIKNKNWDNNDMNSAPEFLCLSPISIKQFELAMNSQAQQPFINHLHHHSSSICD